MRALQFLILLLVPFFNCYAAEKATPVFDNREWKLGASDTSRPGGVFDEYVLSTETIDNWSELVTIQFFPGLNESTNLDVFEGASKEGLTRICPNIKWNSLYNAQSERMWSWTSTGCQGQPDQSEMVRAVKTKTGIHLFHYATKRSPIPAEIEKIWIECLKKITISGN